MAGTRIGWVERMVQAAESGVPLDLSEIKGSRKWDDKTHVWPRNATIPANAIRVALLKPGLRPDPHGLTVVGARFGGAIDLDDLDVPIALTLQDCRFDEAIHARRSQWRAFSIEDSHFPGADLSETKVDYAFDLSRIRASGPVLLQGVRAHGWLQAIGANVRAVNTVVLNLDNAQVDGGVFLTGLHATGEVRALGAHITGQLDLSNAELHNPGGNTLTLNRMQIEGNAFLTELHSTGGVCASSTYITGQLDLRKANLNNPKGVALTLDSAQVNTNVFLTELLAIGEVRAIGANIAGQLVLTDATLDNPEGVALGLDSAQINASARLTRLRATGEIHALGAHIAGQLSLQKAELDNPKGIALGFDGAQIDRGAFLSGLHATGEVRAIGAHIAGQLDLTDAILANHSGAALNLYDAEINGGTFFTNVQSTGEIRALDAHFSGQLDLRNAVLQNPNGNTLTLENANVDTLFLLPAVNDGETSLQGATIGTLEIGETSQSLPIRKSLQAQGLRIGDLEGPLRVDPRFALRWLDTATKFSPQPWHALAEVYDRNGHPDAARRMRYEAAKRTTLNLPLRARLPRLLYNATVGYGYHPFWAAVWLMAIGVLAFSLATGWAGHFVPTDLAVALERQSTVVTGSMSSDELAAGYPAFSSIQVALDVALPIARVGSFDAWRPESGSWIVYPLVALKTLAWLMTVLFLAGITGILRKT